MRGQERPSAGCWPPSPAAATCCSRTIPAPARPRSPRRSRARSARSSSACSSRPTCCPRTSSASRSSIRASRRSSSTPGRSSPRSCWPTKSTARRRARSRRCSKRWPRARSRIEGDDATRWRELFFVIATQNPVEFRGTYPLPEAQMDRFALRLRLGYVSPRRRSRSSPRRSDSIRSRPSRRASTLEDVRALAARGAACAISDELKRYAVDLARATRAAPGGAARRRPARLARARRVAQALALFDGADVRDARPRAGAGGAGARPPPRRSIRRRSSPASPPPRWSTDVLKSRRPSRPDALRRCGALPRSSSSARSR